MKEYIKNNKDILIALAVIWIIITLTTATISLFIIGKKLSSLDANIDDIEYNTHNVGTELNEIRFKLDHLEYLKYLDPNKEMKDAMWQKALRESKQ